MLSPYSGAPPVPHHLLSLLRDVAHVRSMTIGDWDDTIRLARRARLLGVLAQRIVEHAGLWGAVPEAVRGHLRSSINFAAHRDHVLGMELDALARALPAGMQVVLLKGAAYRAQSMAFARGRIPSDVDLLVRRNVLAGAEASLTAAGWRSEAGDAYDQRYYREWSHELPPMRYPGHVFEVDLHHTIAPVTGRVQIDEGLLFGDLVALPQSRYLVLGAQDQILHAAIHLFQDSDLGGRLRDLVDIDGLIRHHLGDAAAWSALRARAERHGAAVPLWYALRYCGAWLQTPIRECGLPTPPAWSRAVMEWMFPRCVMPRLPERPAGVGTRLARLAGTVRYHWLRMPPPLLARHLLHKSWTALRPRAVKNAG